MSSGIFKLAACSRALLHRALPSEQFDDDRIYKEFLADHAEELVIALAGLHDAPGFDEFAERCLDTLGASNSPIAASAVTEADELVEAGDFQHLGVVALLVVGGALTGLGIAVSPAIILALRVKKITATRDGIEAEYFEGVPKETAAILKNVSDHSPKFDQLVGKLT